MLSRVQRQLQRQALASLRQYTVRPAIFSSSISHVRSFATAPQTTADRARPPMFGFSGKQATALFESAKSDNNVQQVASELRKFNEAFENDEDLMMDLMSPLIRGEQFEPKLQQLFPELDIQSKQAQELITELVTTRGAGKLRKILDDYDQLSQWDRHEVTANVTSAQPLSDGQRQRLKEALQRSIGKGEQLVLNEQVDESLLGGLKVELGDRAIDLSVASRLGEVDRELRTQ